MQTTIITPGTYGTYGQELESYHRLRHDIFVSLQGLGRNDLYAAAGQETDIWDLPHFHPVHFLVTNEGHPVAVGRMTSAIRPTMMNVLYPEFLDSPVTGDASIWEVQRVGVDFSRLDSVERERAFLTLFTQMEAFAMRNGIQRLMLLTFEGIWKKRLSEMQRMGPTGTHLGFPHVALINELNPVTHAERCAALEQMNQQHTAREKAA